MYISKVSIRNYKCFQGRFNIDLNESINVIVGNNETGKSTILEALHLALMGTVGGNYFQYEINRYLFNNEVVKAYESSLIDGPVIELPSIIIEVIFSDGSFPEFKGSKNLDGEIESYGFQFRVCFDDNHQEHYHKRLESGEVKSLPIEYYKFQWQSFANSPLFAKEIPVTSTLIDTSDSRIRNGSDVYVNRIVKDFLGPEEKIVLAQAYSMAKSSFDSGTAMGAINRKLTEAVKISAKKVHLSSDVSRPNSWESNLVTYLADVPFQYAGKGEQCLVKTRLALAHRRTTNSDLILIEEPENHLSFSKLNSLIHEIGNATEGKQIILSTHSSFVANKLGLKSLILLENQKHVRLNDLEPGTKQFFEKLPGYNTLRLLLCDKAILVEGDCDELVVQKAFLEVYGKLPIEDEVDVISVGTSFKRFLEIAVALEKEVVVVTDTDGDIEALQNKYSDYLGDNARDNIRICFEGDVDTRSEIGGNKFNFNTLEPYLLKYNGLDVLNAVFATKFASEEELLLHMKSNKTKCALAIFNNTNCKIIYPEYIMNAIYYPAAPTPNE